MGVFLSMNVLNSQVIYEKWENPYSKKKKSTGMLEIIGQLIVNQFGLTAVKLVNHTLLQIEIEQDQIFGQLFIEPLF